jgi:NAD(P) transhydrogenase subunit alpha
MPKLTILRDSLSTESVVMILPQTITCLVQKGWEIYVEKGLGQKLHITDEAYALAGAKISKIPLELIADADAVLQPRPVHMGQELLTLMREGALLIGWCDLANGNIRHWFDQCVRKRISVLALDAFSMQQSLTSSPRVQLFDINYSFQQVSGYKAVIEAFYHLPHVAPLWHGALRVLPPSRVLILGAGIAGFQAALTAKSLGADVWMFDTRISHRQTAESCGARWVSWQDGLDSFVGDTEQQWAWQRQQQQAYLSERLKQSDVVIATHWQAGHKAHIWITDAMVSTMPKGSVIIDLAIHEGGNCSVSQCDQRIDWHGVTLLAPSQLAHGVYETISHLYSAHLEYIMQQLWDESRPHLWPSHDDLLQRAYVIHDGRVIQQQYIV